MTEIGLVEKLKPISDALVERCARALCAAYGHDPDQVCVASSSWIGFRDCVVIDGRLAPMWHFAAADARTVLEVALEGSDNHGGN